MFNIRGKVTHIRNKCQSNLDGGPHTYRVGRGHTSLFNPLMVTCNYSATLNNIKLVHWLLMGGLLHLVQREGDWAEPQPLFAVPNVTVHPSTASVPITVLLYNIPLLRGINVPIKGLTVHL